MISKNTREFHQKRHVRPARASAGVPAPLTRAPAHTYTLTAACESRCTRWPWPCRRQVAREALWRERSYVAIGKYRCWGRVGERTRKMDAFGKFGGGVGIRIVRARALFSYVTCRWVAIFNEGVRGSRNGGRLRQRINSRAMDVGPSFEVYKENWNISNGDNSNNTVTFRFNIKVGSKQCVRI